MLFKQILSDRSSISFIPESFDNDNEVLKSVNDGYNELIPYIEQLYKIFESLDSYDKNGIYIKREYISTISQNITGDWSTVTNKWNSDYDDSHLNVSRLPKDMDKYYDKRKTAYSQIDSFSVSEIQKLIGDAGSVSDHYGCTTLKLIEDIRIKYKDAEQLFINEYNYDKKLVKNDFVIDKLKALLDNIKELERTIKQLMGTGKEDNKNAVFYGDIQPAYDALREFDRLYDKVRNYITKKPYSKDKIKLNFQNPQFLNGWDRNKETDYRSTLLKKGDNYYLAVMDRSYNKVFESYPSDDSNGWQKINYKLLPGPNKMLPKVFFAKSNIDYFAPSSEILEIRAKKTYKTNKGDCEKLIDFYKEALEKHEDWRDFGFSFKDTKSYKDLDEFYNDIKVQGYKISYSKISENYLMDLVDEGKIYLFKIYNKDFSEYSKGTPNLHTLYFKMIFDERNLKDVVYKLSGGAEMFYRFPSLKLEETTVHHAGDIVNNKNLSNPGEKELKYDIIKDKRFTRPQFSIHIPIAMNFKSRGIKQCNYDVRYDLKTSEENYVIGIDRGERHLLYVTVINSKGEIVEQYSLNEIVNEYKGVKYPTDYHKLLDKKEEDRDKARKNWKTIEGIRELKEGYISQAVHRICQLVVKYDAIIAMEDLNMGFKQSRIKVEKQVYQKFEKMLIDKLNYLVVDKNMDPEENGGLLRAYQLTEKFTSFSKMGKQNGFIFYVPAYLTSKIDPVTGFVDLLKPKYENIEKTKNMISNFDFVRYNAADDIFEFGIDYSNVERGSTSFVKKWTVCTNGERIHSFRNKDKNSEWDNETVILTNAFRDLFDKHGIGYSDGEDIKKQLLQLNRKDFFIEFTGLLRLTLQMRNSKTGTDIDYLISPVRDKNGKFYNSDDFSCKENAPLPKNADANGAYNIARKALWCIEQIKATEDDKLDKVNLAMTNKEWLEYAQKG